MKCMALALLCLFAVVRSMHAQINVYSLSSFSKPGQILPDVCRQEQALFVQTFREFPHPSTWTYLIACDDNQWLNVLAHIGVEPSLLKYGATIEGKQVTYFRGSTFLHPDVPGSEPRHVIAHELAHIYLNSPDDVMVDALAHRWMKSTYKPLRAAEQTACHRTPSAPAYSCVEDVTENGVQVKGGPGFYPALEW